MVFQHCDCENRDCWNCSCSVDGPREGPPESDHSDQLKSRVISVSDARSSVTSPMDQSDEARWMSVLVWFPSGDNAG
eukprot:7590778-Pyramimonas_sp.AAC.1